MSTLLFWPRVRVIGLNDVRNVCATHTSCGNCVVEGSVLLSERVYLHDGTLVVKCYTLTVSEDGYRINHGCAVGFVAMSDAADRMEEWRLSEVGMALIVSDVCQENGSALCFLQCELGIEDGELAFRM